MGNSIRPGARATSTIGSVRVHGRASRDWFRKTAGRDERYDYLYSADELQPWIERTREIARNPRVEKTFVVTNNHPRGQAPANALMIASMLEGGLVAAPPDLYREYRNVLRAYVAPSGAERTRIEKYSLPP